MKRPRYSKAEEIELVPDAWARFERAVDAAVKSGPKHRLKAGEKRPLERGSGGKRKLRSAPKGRG